LSLVGETTAIPTSSPTKRAMLPNALRFCCRGLRRPPPSPQTYPARGRRAQAPGSSKRGLGRLELDKRRGRVRRSAVWKPTGDPLAAAEPN
jgi:hypothetical protein